MSDNILVSIVIPCRNEAAHIATVLKNVNEQDYPTSSIEVLVADGQSDDNTREIVQNFNDTVRKVILLDNPERIVPYALNKAIALAKGQYIIRLDAHTVYASNYVSKIMETFASTGADIVGGPMHAIGKTNLQNAVAYATSTSFGVGDSKFHNINAAGYTDSVYLGAWNRNIFVDVGLFDTAMVRNQDDEFHYRARSLGKTIYLNPEIKSLYYPRNSLKALFIQYFQYGLYKPLVLKKVKSGIRIRHLIPSMFVLYLLFLPWLNYFFGFIFFLPMTMYIISLLFFCNMNPGKLIEKLLSFPVYLTIHLGYGTGFLAGISKIKL